jgi:hypothetical protein
MATFSSNIYVAEINTKPNNVEAFVHIWNSAATISNPTSRVYKNRVDVSATYLTGSNSASSNVQTGKVFTTTDADGGEDFIYEWRADVEGRTLNKQLLIHCDQLPR